MAQITADDLNGLGGDIRRLISGLRPLLLDYDKIFHNYDKKTTEWCVTTACVLFVFYTNGLPPMFEKTLKGGGVATVVTGLPGSGKSTYAAGLALHVPPVDVDTINEFASFGVLMSPWHGPCSLVCEFLIHLYMRHGYDFSWVVIIQDAGFYANAFAMLKRYGYTVNIVNTGTDIATCHERLCARTYPHGQSNMSLEDLTRLQFSIENALLILKLQDEKKLIGAHAAENSDHLQVIADNVKKLPSSRWLRTLLYYLVQSQIVAGVAAPGRAFYEFLYCARVEKTTPGAPVYAHTLVEPVTLPCGHSFCEKCVGAPGAASCCIGVGGHASLSKPLKDLIAHTTPKCANLVLSHEATHAMVEKTGNAVLLETSKAVGAVLASAVQAPAAKIYAIIALQDGCGPDSAFYSLLTCAICLCVCDMPVTLPCGHLFCKKCIDMARASSNALLCPTCRAAIPTTEILPTFLLCSLIAKLN